MGAGAVQAGLYFGEGILDTDAIKNLKPELAISEFSSCLCRNTLALTRYSMDSGLIVFSAGPPQPVCQMRWVD